MSQKTMTIILQISQNDFTKFIFGKRSLWLSGWRGQTYEQEQKMKTPIEDIGDQPGSAEVIGLAEGEVGSNWEMTGNFEW